MKILRVANLTLVGVSSLMLCTLAHAAGTKPVKTAAGKVRGVPTTDGKAVAYKGIPYAAPPVGDLRWRPPQPAGKWKGVLDAKDFGAHCIQSGGYPDMVFHDPGPSEDCLTLNVWVPAGAKPSSHLPVMVWIYGGGFTTGSTSENRQDGQFLARRGVIVVSMNYRLGVFGFMALPELTAESPQHAAGNYGLMDQAAALAWVKRNIAAFGGNAANITIFGQSAGSISVSALMASPMSRDLIAKAIGQSGAAFYSAGLGTRTREETEQTDAAWAQRVFSTTKLAELRKLSPDDLVKAATARPDPAKLGSAPPRFGIDIDGAFLPDTLPHIFASGKQAHVPLMVGWVANEQRPTVRPTLESLHAQAQQDFGDRAQDFLAAYPAASDSEAMDAAGNYASDRFIAFSTWAWAEAAAASGKPVYRYFFALPNPGDRNHSVAAGAFHSDDIEYVFGALDSRPEMKIRPEDRALSELMQQYWINFARTGDPNKSGDPNGPGLPQWPIYNGESNSASPSGDANARWQVMRLDAVSAANPDPARARYLFLDSVWGKAAGR